MAKFMGREIPVITMKLKDIVVIPDYHKHECTGRGDYEFVAVTALDEKRKRDMTLVRCKTCGKVFTSENPFGKFVHINNSEAIKKKEEKKKKKKKRPEIKEIELEEGTPIYLINPNMHRCLSFPEYVSLTAKLFPGERKFKLVYCRTCKKFFHTGERAMISSLNRAYDGRYDLHMSDDLLNVGDESRGTADTIRIRPKDFLVVTSVKRCAVKGHELQDVDARVRVLTKKGKIIDLITPAIYCRSCMQYYMLDQDYERVLRHGTPICRTITIETFIQMKEGKIQYNDESLLHSLGYNVNAQEGLTDRERQRILSIVIDEGAMSTAEVLSFLDYLIRRSQGRPLLDNARGKWNRDRRFVSQYRRRPSPSVDVQSITIRKYKSR